MESLLANCAADLHNHLHEREGFIYSQNVSVFHLVQSTNCPGAQTGHSGQGCPLLLSPSSGIQNFATSVDGGSFYLP